MANGPRNFAAYQKSLFEIYQNAYFPNHYHIPKQPLLERLDKQHEKINVYEVITFPDKKDFNTAILSLYYKKIIHTILLAGVILACVLKHLLSSSCCLSIWRRHLCLKSFSTLE